MTKEDLMIPELVTASQKQISGLIHERNHFRNLLEICLHVFNTFPNMMTKLESQDHQSTYKIANQIEQAFKKYD